MTETSLPDLQQLLFVIPAKDEEASIGNVVRSLKTQFSADVLVISDGSTDSTVERAKEAGAIVLTQIISLGAWRTMQTGIRFAVKHDYQFVITMDGDGQHLAEEVPKLLAEAKDNDVVIGSCIDRGSILRHFAWNLFRITSGLKIKDITSGFRLYNSAALHTLENRVATLLEFQDLGVLLLLRSVGLNIREVNVSMNVRVDGKSRIFRSWFRVAQYMLETALVCLTKAVPLRDVRYLKRFR